MLKPDNHALCATSRCVAGAARDVLKEVASKGLSKADIARGKAQLKLSVLVAAESAETIIEDMGAQVRQRPWRVRRGWGGEGGAMSAYLCLHLWRGRGSLRRRKGK